MDQTGPERSYNVRDSKEATDSVETVGQEDSGSDTDVDMYGPAQDWEADDYEDYAYEG